MVTVCSNNFTVDPVKLAKRYNRKEKKEIQISQPNVIAEYNKSMGGVDLHDNGIANYRCRVMGKKWWWPIFSNAVDSAVVNAWKIYHIANETKLSQLEFKSYVALRLLKIDSDKTVTRKSQTINSIPEIRFDNIGHYPILHETKARRRCKICHKHTIYLCKKCEQHLHTACFEQYHKKQ